MVLVAVMLPLFLSLSGLAMGVSQILSMRSEVVSVTDASAQAAAETLSRTHNVEQARAAAIETAAQNLVANQSFQLDEQSVEFGTYVRINSESRFQRNSATPNAVRVTGKFDANVAFVEIVPSMLKHATTVEIVRSSTFAETDRDIALVVDRSSSMAYDTDIELPPLIDDFPFTSPLGELPPPPTAPTGWTWCMEVPAPSRFTTAIAGSTLFLTQLTATSPTELVTLITFAEMPTVDTPLTNDYPSIITALRNRALQFCGGSSNKGNAITLAAETLLETGRPFALKSIILVTDNPNALGDPTEAARLARQAGVVVHTISLGGTSDSPAAVAASEIAEAGNGFHRHAKDLLSFKAAMQVFASHVPFTLVEEK